MLPTVAVLLSTYNGEGFLEAQLASLCEQQGVALRIFIRDDGSSDGTLRLLHDQAARIPQIASVTQGVNLGAAWSFLTLLRDVPDGFDYYAFCDQDDVWLPEKLARATEQLSQVAHDVPALYCSQVTCVDHQLTPLGQPRANGDTRFHHLLFENIAFGCTTVMNRAARRSLASNLPRAGVTMHDWWCALVISALGQVLYDSESHILYRQHHRNVVGADVSLLAKVLRLAGVFWRDPKQFYPVHAQARELARLYGDQLAPECRKRAEALIHSKASLLLRVRYAFSDELLRDRMIGALSARALIIAGLY